MSICTPSAPVSGPVSAAAVSDPLVETCRLTKRYGTMTALAECNLQVRRGEVFGLLGPNGAGKTTLIRLLMGFLRPSGGQAHIDGLDCYHDSVAVHRRVSYLPGEARLFPKMRGRQVLEFFASIHPRGDLARSIEFARRLDLDLTRPVAYCSTGMRQKLALSATLGVQSPLIILDEPTSNLDPTVRGEVIKLLHEARAVGRTVIFSSHVLSETEQACDRVGIVRAGHLVHLQTIAELRRQHRIHAQLNGPLPPVPAHLDDDLIVRQNHSSLMIQTGAELSTLFGWLAELPITEVRIEPISLQAVYDRFHGEREKTA